MDIIYMALIRNPIEKRAAHTSVPHLAMLFPRFRRYAADAVPAHFRDLQTCTAGCSHVLPLVPGIPSKSADGRAEYPETTGIALLTVFAHQLHSYADTQDRLRERGDELVQSCLAQLFHCRRCLSHSGKYHPAGGADDGGIGSDDISGIEPFEGIFHGTEIACSVIYYCCLHVHASLDIPHPACGSVRDDNHNTPLLLGSE